VARQVVVHVLRHPGIPARALEAVPRAVEAQLWRVQPMAETISPLAVPQAEAFGELPASLRAVWEQQAVLRY